MIEFRPRPLVPADWPTTLRSQGFTETEPGVFVKVEGAKRVTCRVVHDEVEITIDMLVGIRPLDVDEIPEGCHLCGEVETDLNACAACGQLFCDDCGDWCHADGDEDCGDHFCEVCQDG